MRLRISAEMRGMDVADRLDALMRAEQFGVARGTAGLVVPIAVAMEIDHRGLRRVGIVGPEAEIVEGDDLVLAWDAHGDEERPACRDGARLAQQPEGAARVLLLLGDEGDGFGRKTGLFGHGDVSSQAASEIRACCAASTRAASSGRGSIQSASAKSASRKPWVNRNFFCCSNRASRSASSVGCRPSWRWR